MRHLEAEDNVVGGEPELGDVVVAEALDPLARVRTPRREPTVLPVLSVLLRQANSVILTQYNRTVTTCLTRSQFYETSRVTEFKG